MRRYQRLLQEVLKLDIAYLPIKARDKRTTIQAEDFAHAIRGLGAIGGAISKDIKGKIIPHLDELDAFAQEVQSVNTVIRKGDRLIGHNTDAYGFELAIREGLAASHTPIDTAVVYGYGGVFQVVHYVLTRLGLKVHLTGRDAEKVAQVNEEYGLAPFSGPCDLFVNATPVTDAPLDQATNFLEALKGARMVFDHHMPGLALAEFCQANDVHYVPGTAMYYPQMYKQWALFLEGMVTEEELPALFTQVSGNSSQT
ncbi:MAG: shikimate dehydrogenase [Bacteroidota bacterium]